MKRIIIAFGVLILLLVIGSAIIPLHIPREYSQIITSSDGTVLHAFLTSDDKWRMQTEKDDVSDKLRKAILYKEDKYFYYHFL